MGPLSVVNLRRTEAEVLEQQLAVVYGITAGQVAAAVQEAERGVQESLSSADSAAAAASGSRSAEAPGGDGTDP